MLFDVSGRGLKTVDADTKAMAERYAFRVSLESYDFEGEFYFVGEGHGTPAEVLRHVGTDHIMRIDQTKDVTSYLIDVLQEAENVSEDEYEAWDADVSCGIHADVSHWKYSFWTGERVVQIGREPTREQLREIADSLGS